MAETAKGIREREELWGMSGRVIPGPADTNIFTEENGTSLANEMSKPVRLSNGKMVRGIQWTRADKRPGSRKMGWKAMVERFENAKPTETNFVREKPGLFVFGEHCPQFLRTVPILPRDEKDMDDVDTDAEDHIGDTARYRVVAAGGVLISGSTSGMF